MESAPRALGCNEVVTPGRALHYGDNDKDDDDDNDNDDDKDDDVDDDEGRGVHRERQGVMSWSRLPDCPELEKGQHWPRWGWCAGMVNVE